MSIGLQAYLQGYMHEKTANRKPGTGTGRARRGYDTQDFGWAEQLNAAAKAVPGGLWQGVKNVGHGGGIATDRVFSGAWNLAKRYGEDFMKGTPGTAGTAGTSADKTLELTAADLKRRRELGIGIGAAPKPHVMMEAAPTAQERIDARNEYLDRNRVRPSRRDPANPFVTQIPADDPRTENLATSEK